MPTTTEEFFEVCKLAVEKDFNGNGKKDEIALTGAGLDYMGGAWFRYLMSPYVYAEGPEYRFVEDGKVQLAYTTEKWKEGLKYIKRFFDEGLIPKETLTQGWDQYTSLLYAQEQVLFGFNWFFYDGEDAQRGSKYSCITALTGPDGVQRPMAEEAIPAVNAVITSDCENPEAAFLVADLMSRPDLAIIQRSGEEGVDWDYWENAKVEDKSDYQPSYPGNDISIIRYNDDAFWNGIMAGKPQNKSYMQQGPYITPKSVALGLAMNTESSEQKTQWNNIIMNKWH